MELRSLSWKRTKPALNSGLLLEAGGSFCHTMGLSEEMWLSRVFLMTTDLSKEKPVFYFFLRFIYFKQSDSFIY